ncbi:hypothetical protein FHS15_004489 [Paenibacillus castaneae]|nr:hypothetical protein [Paenibacillus castaneae]
MKLLEGYVGIIQDSLFVLCFVTKCYEKRVDLFVVLLLIRMYNNTKRTLYFHQLPNDVQ